MPTSVPPGSSRPDSDPHATLLAAMEHGGHLGDDTPFPAAPPPVAAAPLPQENTGHNRRRNTLAIAGGKGGVGKTWLAASLAQAMALRGMRVLLMDADVGLPDLDIQLGIVPRQDLGAVLNGATTLKGAVQTVHEAGFDLIAGRGGSGHATALPAPRLEALRRELATLARRYDWVILDLASGIGREARLLATVAATTLVVTVDEPPALADTYTYCKAIRAANPLADLRLVVNQAADHPAGEAAFARLETACRSFLHFAPPLAGIIRSDPQVPAAIRDQTPLFSRTLDSPAACDVRFLAERLITGV